MARKLPWGGDTPATPTQPTPRRAEATRPAPRVKREQNEVVHGTTSARKRAASRSPSTSPPPGPPDVEPMFEGFDADDAFMMVEDEFQTVAQSLTGHLHHAEYKRLMRKARESAKKALPEITSNMPTDTSTRLKGEHLRQWQKEGVDEATGRMDLTEDAEEKVDDPWSGTSLAGLMTSSSSQKTSLKGLDRMSSNTRAAKGFGRLGGETPEKKKSVIDIFAKHAPVSMVSTAKEQPGDANSNNVQTSSSTMTSTRHVRPSDRQRNGEDEQRAQSSSASRPLSSTNASSITSSRSVSTRKEANSTRTATKRSVFTFDDGFDEAMIGMAETVPIKTETQQDPIATKLPKSTKVRETTKDEKKRRVDEVPIFIV